MDRLALAFGLTAVVLLLAGAVVSEQVLKTTLRREDDDLLHVRLRVMAALLAKPEGETAARREVREEEADGRTGRVLLDVHRLHGRLVARTPGWRDLLDKRRARHQYRELSLTVPGPPGSGRRYRIRAVMSREQDARLLDRYRTGIALLLAVGLVSAFGLGWVVASRGLEPVREITASLSRLGSGSLHERLRLEGLPEELALLGGSFNALLDRLDDSFDRLGRFSSDIAHELRTPLQAMRGVLEVSASRPRSAEEYREVADSCLEECVALSRLIDKLLFLARAENPQTRIQRAWIEVDRELAGLADLYEALAQEAGVELQLEVATGLRARVDRTLFGRAVANLLDNAVAHTPPGGRIELVGRPCGEGVSVSVRDNGCGMSPRDVERAGERFFRADACRSDRTGAGLGLSIVHGVATLHGGSLVLESQPGKGTRATLSFPPSDQEA